MSNGPQRKKNIEIEETELKLELVSNKTSLTNEQKLEILLDKIEAVIEKIKIKKNKS